VRTVMSIPRSEWEAALELVGLLEHAESDPLGQVRLRCDGRRRRWFATDLYRAVFIDGGPDQATVDVGLSPALIEYAVVACRFYGEVQFVVQSDGPVRTLGVIAAGSSMWVDDLQHEFRGVSHAIPLDGDVAGRATVASAEFTALVDALSYPRELQDDRSSPTTLQIGVSGDEFQLVTTWPKCGTSRVAVTCRGASGNGLVTVTCTLLRSLLELFPSGSDIEVLLPRHRTRPIVLVSGDIGAFLMPMHDARTNAQARVEATIEKACGRLATALDGDGNYMLQQRSTPIFGRLLFDDGQATLEVFARLLTDIDASAELLAELNDLNTGSSFARVFHHDREIRAEVDIHANTLDVHSLRSAIQRIHDLADRIMPMFAAVLGGDIVDDTIENRLRRYRHAFVEAELPGGSMVSLNGPGPVEWPFDRPLYVITMWNPQGLPLAGGPRDNVVYGALARVMADEGRFVPGRIRSADGDSADPALILWGISRDQALIVARNADQDAVLEIDADSVHIVSCLDDTFESWSRVGG
jgi:hypothetical protein